MARIKDRIYRLLTLLYPWSDIAAARWTLEHGDPRSRASASEYLDNVLSGAAAQADHAVLEDMPPRRRCGAATSFSRRARATSRKRCCS